MSILTGHTTTRQTRPILIIIKQTRSSLAVSQLIKTLSRWTKFSIWKLNPEFVWIVLDHFQWRLPIVSSNRISFQWGLWPLSLCSIGLISFNNMVHIDNNKFNILTVTGYSLRGRTDCWPELYCTNTTHTWENIIKVATEVILIILQTKKPFTGGVFDEAKQKC